jgi:regulatory protein YycI of two-component signal transduction system YycFG
MSKLFQFNGKLPQAGDDITIYETMQTKEQRESNLKARNESLSKIFGIAKGKTLDLGDKLQITEKTKNVSLYAASDSFWYQDDKLFASENKKQGLKLPEPKLAEDIAKRFLKSNGLLLSAAEFHSTSYTTVAVNKEGSSKVDEYNTELHVNFRYTLDKLPVFGPGAKTRVSLVDENTQSGVYHFWRDPKPAKRRMKLLSPELALELFYKNFRFAQLNPDTAKATIDDMQLGYYAMSPTDVQNYLVPVYRVTGTISTETFPRYDFTHYIVAVKYTDDDVKAMGVSIKGVKSMVF